MAEQSNHKGDTGESFLFEKRRRYWIVYGR